MTQGKDGIWKFILDLGWSDCDCDEFFGVAIWFADIRVACADHCVSTELLCGLFGK